MDHNEIDNLDFVERYLMGGLMPDEIVRFEEHFVACPRCVEQLRTTEDFMKGIRLAAATQAVPSGWFLSRISVHRLILAGISLLLLICTGIWIGFREMRLRSEANQAKGEMAQLAAHAEEERLASKAAAEESRASEAKLQATIEGLTAQIAARERTIKSLKTDTAMRIAALAEPPPFSLQAEERSVSFNFKPQEIKLKMPVRASFQIAFGLEGVTYLREYCVSAFNSSGKEVDEKKCGLTPKGLDVVCPFKSASFRNGFYRFEVEGLKNDGSWQSVGTYPCRIIRTGIRRP